MTIDRVLTEIVDDWGVFFYGFCISLVLPGVFLFLVLLLGKGIGQGLGLPLLIWVKGRNGRPGFGQFGIGIGIGVLIWQVLFAGYLAEEWATAYTWDHPPICEVRVPDLGGLDDVPHPGAPDDSGRFRYRPTDLIAIGHYALVVVASIVFIGVAASLGVILLQAIFHGASAPFRERWVPFFRRHDIPRPPRSLFLPAGILAGLLFMAGVAWLALSGPAEAFCTRTGNQLMAFGGWGKADGRRAQIDALIAVRKGTKTLARTNLAQEWALLAAALEGEHRPAKTPAVDLKRIAAIQSRLDGVKQDVLATLSKDRRAWTIYLKSVYANGQADYLGWMAPYSPIFGLFFLTFVGVSVFTAGLSLFPSRRHLISPAGWILFFLHLAVFLFTFLAYFVPISNQVILVALMGLAVLGGRSYKLQFPNLDFGPRPVDLRTEFRRIADEERANPDPPDDPEAPTFRTRFIDYVREDGQGRLKPPIALVCVSGGGSRAALWTMSVLERLENDFLTGGDSLPEWIARPPVAFPYHVRLMTGASGGMLAASAYAASLDAPPGGGGPGEAPPSAINRVRGLPELVAGTGQNFLAPTAHRLATHDLWWVLLPFRARRDRGWEIEDAWRRAYDGVLDRTFADLKHGERNGWRPSLIFSPMLVEDGRQLFISNLSLRSVTHNLARVLGTNPAILGPDGDHRQLLSREGVEFFDLFPEAHHRFQVGTAARMSASFPYVLPAATLPTNPMRRVVDAGYYDNYGVGIALSWLDRHLDWVKRNTSGVVLIQIRDGESDASRRREEVADSFAGLIDRGLHWATSPPEGLWQSRMASNAFRNDKMIHLMTEQLGSRGFPDDFFATVSFDFVRGEDVSLSWMLTSDEVGWIRAGVEGPEVSQRVRSLLDWWHGRLASPEARRFAEL